MTSDYDVIVIGGGTAGTIAAVQAGRLGVRALLAEKNAMLAGRCLSGKTMIHASEANHVPRCGTRRTP
jgi:pyruvate/2-oxoglutarate dehydrogenase complex dihydrolipoamide dehydrogenase (E3) component